jgi:hypothetical protein
MRLNPSLKNLVRLKLSIFFIIALQISGCISSTEPTYLNADIDKAIQDISKVEYNIDLKVRRMGQTLLIYLPLEDLFEKSDKPERYLEKFSIENNDVEFKEGLFKVSYIIKKIPEEEKTQDYKYKKEVVEKINNVWKVLRRVIFSMERSKDREPKFFFLVVADIKNGFEIREIFYISDLKKVSYEFISWTEYQHRAISQTEISPAIIGDKEGLHLDYGDITLEEFIAKQIEHRIKLKFQKPEIEKNKNIDIDDEILKIVVNTIKTYNLRDFKDIELNNLFTQNRVILNRQAVWTKSFLETKF